MPTRLCIQINKCLMCSAKVAQNTLISRGAMYDYVGPVNKPTSIKTVLDYYGNNISEKLCANGCRGIKLKNTKDELKIKAIYKCLYTELHFFPPHIISLIMQFSSKKFAFNFKYFEKSLIKGTYS